MRLKTIYKELDKIYSLFLSPKTSDQKEAFCFSQGINGGEISSFLSTISSY